MQSGAERRPQAGMKNCSILSEINALCIEQPFYSLPQLRFLCEFFEMFGNDIMIYFLM